MTVREWIRAVGIIIFCIGILFLPTGYISPKEAISFLPNALAISPNLFLNLAIYFLGIGLIIIGISYIKLPKKVKEQFE